MSDINEIRKEVLTEDAKMEIIADTFENSGGIDVVTIHDMSGTLSDEDFKKISSNHCLMMASTQYFYKNFSASTLIKYGALPRLGTGKIIFETIEIDKATKHYEFKTETFSTE